MRRTFSFDSEHRKLVEERELVQVLRKAVVGDDDSESVYDWPVDFGDSWYVCGGFYRPAIVSVVESRPNAVYGVHCWSGTRNQEEEILAVLLGALHAKYGKAFL
ncbi:MAG: hypothetical protein ABTQ34_02005 [Bdellovibrionales bacterium]